MPETIKKHKTAVRWVILVVAALLMAVGLEALQLHLLPPIFTDMDVTIIKDPDLMETSRTYLHESGRTALVEQWDALRLFFTFLMQLILLAVLFPLGLMKYLLNGLKKGFSSLVSALSASWRRDLLLLGIFAASAAAMFFLTRFLVVYLYHKAESNWMIDLFSLLCGISLAMMATFRQTLSKKPEIFFLAFMIMIGGLMSFLMPASSVLAWDDGFHYQHALNFSTMGHVRYTQADMDAMDAANVKIYALGEERDAFLKARDEANAKGSVYVTVGFHMQPKEVWMAFYGLGLFLGRLFHLSYWLTWSLGRFTGLLAYSIIGYFAIRRLKSGKLILASVLMIPEAIFLACNYSYDPSVTCCLALLFAYFTAQWQEKGIISEKDQLVMILSGFFGCLAKAIYFPIVLLPLLLPKSRFRDGKAWKRFIYGVLLAVFLLLVSFVLPFIFSDGTGDTRGGDGVNAFGQVAFILGNPLKYTEILLNFLREYLNVNYMTGALTFFAYMGSAPNGILCLILLAVAAFTDRGEADEKPGPGIRVIVLLFAAATIVLLTTALYVSYNPVGSEGIGGVQPRYLLPLMYPILAMLGSGNIRNSIPRGWYNGVCLGICGYMGFVSVLHTCIVYYN